MSEQAKNTNLYTTGETAKLCGVSVRTIQYYDTRGILIPSELTEGGRRLYSENDIKKLRIICFLRDVGLPINSINELLHEDDPGSVISILRSRKKHFIRKSKSERISSIYWKESSVNLTLSVISPLNR